MTALDIREESLRQAGFYMMAAYFKEIRDWKSYRKQLGLAHACTRRIDAAEAAR